MLIRALVGDLILNKEETLIMDMEAGLEHLGRATTSGVDAMLVVVEPGQRSLDGAHRIEEMAHDIGLSNLYFVANKVVGAEDKNYIRETMAERPVLEYIPFSEQIRKADRPGLSVLDNPDPEVIASLKNILHQLRAPVSVS